MDVTSKKRGRPTSNEGREKLSIINFKADQETTDAIDVLVTAASSTGTMVGIKSAVIRRALIEAAKRVSATTPKRR